MILATEGAAHMRGPRGGTSSTYLSQSHSVWARIIELGGAGWSGVCGSSSDLEILGAELS